jgi:hypothetical protein
MEFFKSLNEAKLHSRQHFEGLDISVEVPADGYRRGKNKKTGEEWAIKIPAHYGYIKGTHSPDGEHLDCYLRKNPKKDARVYVMHQLTVDGSKFDEDKVMLGYSSKGEAIKAFKEVTFKPNVMYGGCTEFDMEHFQVIAFSASNSSAMLTDEKTYSEFKKKGLITTGIKSPIMIAKKISESLSEGLQSIGDVIYKGDLVECLDWSGYNEGFPIETVLSRAYGHYVNTPYMQENGILGEAEFHQLVLNYVMEQDALATDIEDEIHESLNEEIRDDYDNDNMPLADIEESLEETEEEPVMEANNFVVVVHTQMMENIGTAENPSWATAGTKVQLIQEGFADYGAARSIAAKVAAGEVEVDIKEGAYVLGIDVMPTSEYRQFHEEVEEEEKVEEDTTDDVFFSQQIQEVQKLAGVQQGSYQNQGTPSVHETRARLEALSKGLVEALEEEEAELEEAAGHNLTQGQLAQALRIVRETIKANPHASVYQAIRAVCQKHFQDNETIHEAIIKQAELEYGSLDELKKAARQEFGKSKKITKTSYDR